MNQSTARRLAKNMDEQCRSWNKWVHRVRQRCQLPQGHTGAHFGPFNTSWPKKKRRNAMNQPKSRLAAAVMKHFGHCRCDQQLTKPCRGIAMYNLLGVPQESWPLPVGCRMLALRFGQKPAIYMCEGVPMKFPALWVGMVMLAPDRRVLKPFWSVLRPNF